MDYNLQRICYSGYTRHHDLKYSGVMSPCGIFVNMDGPWPGSFHDSHMFKDSGLANQMDTSEIFSPVGQRPFHFYGDQAYPSGAHVIAQFKGNNLTIEQERVNAIMSKLRISVEWGFGIISRLFAFTEFGHNQKLGLQPVGVYFRVAPIFTNIHTCMNGGNIVSGFFHCEPPSVEKYLGHH